MKYSTITALSVVALAAASPVKPGRKSFTAPLPTSSAKTARDTLLEKMQLTIPAAANTNMLDNIISNAKWATRSVGEAIKRDGNDNGRGRGRGRNKDNDNNDDNNAIIVILGIDDKNDEQKKQERKFLTHPLPLL